MIKAAEVRWLYAILDKVKQAHPLELFECADLARGFIGCNLVSDVANFFSRARQAGNCSIGTGIAVTRAELDDLLCAALNGEMTQPLITQGNIVCGRLVNLDPTWCNRNPWRAINTLLAHEIAISIIANGNSANSAFVEANTILLNIMKWTPHYSLTKNAPLTKHFHKWWNITTSQYTETIRENYLEVRKGTCARQFFVDLLRGVTEPRKLAAILVQKNQLWDDLLNVVRHATPHNNLGSISAKWINDLNIRLLNYLSYNARRNDPKGCELSASDRDRLREMIDWAIRSGLDPYKNINDNGMRGTKMWWHVEIPGTAVCIQPGNIEVFMEEFLQLHQAWWFRNIRNHPSTPLAIRDLFFNPLIVAFSRWFARTTSYGMV